MKISKVALLFLLSSAALHGQLSVDGGLEWNGFSLRFNVRVEPPGPGPTPFDGAVIDADVIGGGVAQRFIDDPPHKRSFGYGLKLEPAADGHTAQLRIVPLQDPQRAVRNGWTQFGVPTGLPKYPVIPNLGVGDTVALELLENPSTGQKIVDYLTLARGPIAPPHDFSLADIGLSLSHPHVSLNGKSLESTANFQGVTSGSVVWLYLAGHGRYVLSLFPNPKLGFQKNGQVASGMITFNDGANAFYVECGGTVAPGEGPYNLYVMHDSAWRPRRTSDLIAIGAAADPATLIGRPR